MPSSNPSPIKVVVLGAPNVGKSALVVRFLTKRFIGEYVSGVEISYEHEVNLAGSWVKAEICDSLIIEDHDDNHVRKVISKCDACLLVYNVCDRYSFEYACSVARKIRQPTKSNNTWSTPILIAGNKTDLDHFREVPTDEGHSFSNSLGFSEFVETSASESYHKVERMFRCLFRMVRTKVQISGSSSSGHQKKSLQSKKSLGSIIQNYRKHQASNSHPSSPVISDPIMDSNPNRNNCNNRRIPDIYIHVNKTNSMSDGSSADERPLSQRRRTPLKRLSTSSCENETSSSSSSSEDNETSYSYRLVVENDYRRSGSVCSSPRSSCSSASFRDIDFEELNNQSRSLSPSIGLPVLDKPIMFRAGSEFSGFKDSKSSKKLSLKKSVSEIIKLRR